MVSEKDREYVPPAARVVGETVAVSSGSTVQSRDDSSGKFHD